MIHSEPPRAPRRRPIATPIVAWLACVALLMLSPMGALAGQHGQLQDGKRVLLLYSYTPSFPTSRLIHEGVRSVLDSPKLTLDEAFMDSRAQLDDEGRQRYRAWLAYKLSHSPPYDAVIAADDAAFELARDESTLFASTPVVFMGVNNARAAMEASGSPGITGIIEHVSIAETLAMARKLQPRLKRLLVISDGSRGGRNDLYSLERIPQRAGDPEREVLSLETMRWQELAARLQGLGKDDAVLLLAAFSDRDGVRKNFAESLELIVGHATAPIYHLWAHGIGQGLLGGYVMSHREHGAEAARRVLRIFAGEPAQRIPVLAASPNLPMVDQDRMTHFGLSASALPPGTHLINEQVSLFARHPLQSALGIGLLASLLALSAALAMNNAQKRRHVERLDREQALLRSLLDASPDLIFFKDAEGRFIDANQACIDLIGLPREVVIGHSDADFFPAKVAGDFVERDRQVLLGGKPLAYRETVVDQSGSPQYLDTLKAPVRAADGTIIGVIGVARNVTAKNEDRKRLQLAARVFDHAAEGIIITDPNGIIQAVNPAFSTITGYSSDDAVGQRGNILSSGHHDAAFYERMWGQLQEKGSWQGEIWNRRKSGEIYPQWLNISAVHAEGEDGTSNYVGIFSDISILRSNEEKLDHMAHHDALTDLPNRLLLNDRMEHALQRAEREHAEVGVIFIDLDHFKDINDSYGHSTGDKILCEVARRIAASLREGDTVARLGGDEFVVLLEQLTDGDAVEMAANRINASLIAPLQVGTLEFYVGASMGISLYPRDGTTAQALIRNADTAMYQAKSLGRNNVQRYAHAQTDYARRRVELENALRRAVARRQLTVAFQPQFSLDQRTMTGMEALARWTDPELGSVSPAEFIPVAERSGLIIPLGEFILRSACTQVSQWHAQGLAPPRVAVNVSGRQLRRPEFLSALCIALEDTGCQPQWLELEVTESDILHDAEPAIATLHGIKAMGVAISLDDFGTGFSSLSYLKRLPIETLKIDRSFIDGLPADGNDKAIVEAILAMGHALGIKVLAEGVETAPQAEFLCAAGCAEAQGYLFSRPICPASLGTMLRERRDVTALGVG